MTIEEIMAQEHQSAHLYRFAKQHLEVAKPLAIRFSTEGPVIQYDMAGFSRMVNGSIVCVEYSNLDEFEFLHLSTRVNGLTILACSLVENVTQAVKEKYNL